MINFYENKLQNIDLTIDENILVQFEKLRT
jgi:hypothetical protein